MGKGTCKHAAKVGLEAAKKAPSGKNFLTLSSLMCWDSVIMCAELAKVINQKQRKSLSGLYTTRIISIDDNPVDGKDKMLTLPGGHVMGFFCREEEQWRCAHVMLSVGKGLAAGNKNDCIGMGLPVSWEVLDLANRLTWAHSTGFGPGNVLGGYVDQTIGIPRRLYVRSKEVTKFNDVVSKK